MTKYPSVETCRKLLAAGIVISTNQNNIVMAALKLSKAHTAWMTGKGSVKSFGNAKGVFIKAVQAELTEAYNIGVQAGFDDFYNQAIKGPRSDGA
jgi:hypothetical protein